jgi:acyl-CoA thioester hydrolase
VTRLGNSSVRYEIALFRSGEDEAAATGHFVHVWVDRTDRRPTRVPAEVRAALAALVVSA